MGAQSGGGVTGSAGSRRFLAAVGSWACSEERGSSVVGRVCELANAMVVMANRITVETVRMIRRIGTERRARGQVMGERVNAPRAFRPRRRSGRLARIHRWDRAVRHLREMRGQGAGWRGPDADEMDDVGRGCRAKGILTTPGSGIGSDFQRRPMAETVRSPAWRGWARRGVSS